MYFGSRCGTRSLIFSLSVSNYFARLVASTDIFGITERFLPQLLMWSCLGIHGRRTDLPNVPSWSWASSSGIIDYAWIAGSHVFREDKLFASLVYYYYQDPLTGLRMLDVEERWGNSVYLPADYFDLHDDLPDQKDWPQGIEFTQIWHTCPHGP